MQDWIELGQGSFFRFCFVLMLLGLGRLWLLTLLNSFEAYRRNQDRIINYREMLKNTFGWLIPFGRLWRNRPLFSSISILFHVGLILTPLFLISHVMLWKQSVGFGWFTIPQTLADGLTVIVILTAFTLLLMRLSFKPARELSRKQDYFWLILLEIPFITGYFMTQTGLNSLTYQSMMLVHVYSADLIMLLIPFTKISHCVLAPLSQLVTAISWKFPAGSGKKVIDTLGWQNHPTWEINSRIGNQQRSEIEDHLFNKEESR